MIDNTIDYHFAVTLFSGEWLELTDARGQSMDKMDKMTE